MPQQFVRLLKCVKRVALAIMVGGVLTAVAVTLVLLRWHLTGKQILGVQTGSMQPLFKAGDAVIVQPVSTLAPKHANLHVGDIVAYRSLHDPAVLVTHRIVRIDPQTGWLTTKGDALTAPDPTIPPRLVIGRAVAVAPGLGKVLTAMRQPYIVGLTVYVPALWLVIGEFQRLYRHFASELYRYHGVRIGGKQVSSGKL